MSSLDLRNSFANHLKQRNPSDRTENEELVLKNVVNFVECIRDYWYTDVTYAATVLMKRKRFRNPKLLPFTEDVMKIKTTCAPLLRIQRVLRT